MLGAVALFSLAAYVITPETAAGPAGNPLGFAFNLRYLAPALTLCLVVLPLAPAFESPPARIALTIALAAVLAATVAQPDLWPAHTPGAVFIAVAAVIVVGTLVALARITPPRVVIGLTAVVALAAAIAGHGLQNHYLRGRYVYQPGVSYLARVWALFRTSTTRASVWSAPTAASSPIRSSAWTSPTVCSTWPSGGRMGRSRPSPPVLDGDPR